MQGDRLRGNHRRRLNDQLTSVMGCPVVHVIATDIDVVEVRGHISSRPTAFYLPIEDLGYADTYTAEFIGAYRSTETK